MAKFSTKRRLVLAALLLGGAAVPVTLFAQDMSNEEQKDWLTSFVEVQLSTPERQIRLSNIDGVLGSDVTIREISIADEEGVWLRINNAALNWNQGALFFGKLEVNSLKAESIDYLRNAKPAENSVDLPAPEAGGFEVPQFPVAIQIGEIAVPSVTFGESVFGLGSRIGLKGWVTLENGDLDVFADIDRVDEPGGTLDLDLKYRRENAEVDVTFNLAEPPDGVIANLLNIEGRPAVDLNLIGKGPVSDLNAELKLLANGQEALAGTGRIAQARDGLAVSVDLGGPLSTLVAQPYRRFFGADTRLGVNALVRTAGGFDISDIRLSGGQLGLVGSAETTADNFLSKLDLTATIADPAGGKVVLPLAGAETSVQGAELRIGFGTSADDSWKADLTVANFVTDGFAARDLEFGVGGVAKNLADPAARLVTYNGDGVLSGIAADAGVEAALGSNVGLGLAGVWNAGQPIDLAEFRIAGKALTAGLVGKIDGTDFDGTISIDTASIAPFSSLAGRSLSGGLNLSASGRVEVVGGGFDLVLDGTGDTLRIDDPTVDRLLNGEIKLSGRVARDGGGFSAENFKLGNQLIQVTADGVYASDSADFNIALDLSDLGLVAENASGALQVTGSARSENAETPLVLALDGVVPTGTLSDYDLRDAKFGVAASLFNGVTNGTITGSAALDGHLAQLASQFKLDEVTQSLSGLSFDIAGTKVTGQALRDAETGLINGGFDIAAPDVSLAAALALTEASGALNAKVTLAPVDGEQGAQLTANASDLKVSGISIGRADVAATIGDLFGVPAIDGVANASTIVAGGTVINSVTAKANQSGDSTNFDAQAALATGTNIDLAGALSPIADGYRLALNRANLTQGQLAATLASPTELIVAGESVSLDALRFNVGSGSITASGTAGDVLDMRVVIDALPLNIANTIVPSLGVAGTLNGEAIVTGAASDPNVRFNANANGISTAQIAPFGIAPISASLAGSFAANTVTIESLTANGNGGLNVSGSGRIPLAGADMAVSIKGSAPLALANRFVADRGAQVSGTASFDAQVGGSISSPQFGGSVSLADGGYIDPELNLRLQGITGRASLSGTTATVENLTANLATGGSVSVGGTIGLNGDLPANLTIAINSARYADGDLFIATIRGDLKVTGGLMATPLLSGGLTIEQANITVPDSFGGAGQIIDVDHRSTPADVEQTLVRAKVGTDAASRSAAAGAGPQLALDVTIDAPNQIFIRGRGLDAEVGGSLRLTGPASNIQPVGAFNLIRGRLSILGQRITFTSGGVTLLGDLDPQINLVATTSNDNIDVTVTVSGRASALDVTFGSSPTLPQDEVLSRLIFNRPISELSPLQLAQLAAAAAELVGGGGGGLVGSLRGAAGLADLDVVTDAEGNVGVKAGTYIQDNVYLGVTAGANGQSKVNINLDVTDDLTVRGAAGQDGSSSLGVYFERDY
ncbi:translocation/assembly module TamB domain-containing protein [Devosia sp. MC1541]|uniref:translocation/assembly module TamB domain-containing protein n=1 Tax=Devosia sp. MC1541 TaxID=2725264 RepID=UPI00145E6DBE|nr:translocation/assembly module TamB domain-containing protein [Devosia sp. MC1541]